MTEDILDDAFNEEDRFSILRATKILMRSTLALGVVMAIAIIAVSTVQASLTAMKEYNTQVRSAAWTAASVIDDRHVKGWLTTKTVDYAWTMTDEKLQHMVDSFELDYCYVCIVDAPEYSHITYIFNTVNRYNDFIAWPLGYVQDYDDAQYTKETRKVFEEGKTVVRHVMHDKSGAHITANAPLMDNKGNVVAMIGVRKSMESFVKQRRAYVLVMNIAMLSLSLLFVFVVQSMFKRIVLRPVSVHNVRLRMLKDEAESASRAKSRFLATMSHEIRTPMNAIVGFSELSLRDNAPPAVCERLERINRAARALLAIINDILDYSKIEAGRMELSPVDYSLDALLSDVSSIVKVRISSTSVHFVVDRDPLIPQYLFGDDARLRQILINLGGNAAKFTEDGEIRLSVALHEGSALPGDEGSEVLLDWSVKDTGIGIKEEDVKKLFEAFSQVNMVHSRGKEGTGLGLAICKQLVHLMNGEISVKSTYGEGSEFYFTVPQKVGHEVSTSLKEDNSEQLTCPSARVLLVDDNEVNLLVAQGYLAPYRCAIKTATDGMSAVKAARDNEFDIIFMDHMMPGMDGAQATYAIRERERVTGRRECIVALTADVSSDAKEVFRSKGFDDYLAKPIDSRELDRVMRERIPHDKVIMVQKKSGIAVDPAVLRLFLSQVPTKAAIIKGYASEIAKDNPPSSSADAHINAVNDTSSDAEGEDAFMRYQIEVHALKSSAKVCGFDEVSALATACEKAAKDKDAMYIKEHNNKLLAKYEALPATAATTAWTNNAANTPTASSTGGSSAAMGSSGEASTDNISLPDPADLLASLQHAASVGDVVTLEKLVGQLYAITRALQASCDNMDTEKATKILGPADK